MKFTSIPEAYSSFREPILYTFNTESTTPRDVELKIINRTTGEEIGRKRLYNVTTGEVDIAPYLRSAARTTLPSSIEECGEVSVGTTIKVVVEAEGVTSSSRNFIAATIDRDALFTLLTTQQRHRTMERDEFDLISYFTWPDIVVSFDVEFIGSGTDLITITPPSGGQRTVAVTARGREGVDTIRVSIKVDDQVQEEIEYDLMPNIRGSHRVAWLNTHRSPEVYTFPLRKSVLIEATRRHIESVWGREAAAVEGASELKLLSAYEPEHQLKALAEILHSPRVWLVEGLTVQDVMLTTDRVLLSPNEEMGIIEVDIRAAEEGVQLW